MAQKLKAPRDDYMSRKCDEELEQLEERLTALYANASNEVQAKFTDFLSVYEEEYTRMQARLAEDEITEAQFQAWCWNKILQTQRYRATVESLTDMLVSTDVAAMAILRDELPFVISQSYNFTQSLGSAAADIAGLSVGTFQVYNAWSVQALIRDNTELLPYVNEAEDRACNSDRINTQITHGIIRGESISAVADRLRRVTNMDRNSALRSSRTAMTGAENLGRTESANYIRSRGVPIDEVWMSTHDSRTRDSHLLLDGTKKNPKTGKYGEGILKNPLRFPGDPLGDAAEIYNCRCRDSIVLQGIDHSNEQQLYEQFMRNNYPEDWSQLQAWEAEHGRADERQQALERQERLRTGRNTTKKEVSDLCEHLQQRLTEYTGGEYADICQYSQFIADKEHMASKDPNYASWWEEHRLPYISEQEREDAMQIYSTILEQPISTDPLYRVERGVWGYGDDEVVEMGVRSASQVNLFDDVVAGNVPGLSNEDSDKNNGEWTEIRFISSRSLDISSISVYPDQRESIVAGRYRVVSREIIEPQARFAWKTYEEAFPDAEFFVSKNGNEMVRFINATGSIQTMSVDKYRNQTTPVRQTPVWGRTIITLEAI